MTLSNQARRLWLELLGVTPEPLAGRPPALAGLATSILDGMNPVKHVRYATTWNKLPLKANGANIDATNGVSWGRHSALLTAVYAPALVPLPAYGTRLRGVRLLRLDGPTGFVIQEANELGITRATDLLCLTTAQTLRRTVKRLAHIAGGARKRLGHLAGGFVHEIPQAAIRFRQHRGFPALQLLPAPRAFRLATLCLLDRRQTLVAALNNRLGGSATDQERLLAIGGRDEGIDA